MPAKNSIKVYVENGFYHVYNRGVEKREIFLDDKDYLRFIFYLTSYLLPKEKIIEQIKLRKDLTSEEQARAIVETISLKNFYKKIELFCFCLMPNHYHLLLWQKEKNDLELFMRSVNTRYVKYFNKKYQRIGHLFQGRYKAVFIDKEEYFLHLSRYIHLNPYEILPKDKPLKDYPWSSYPIYLNNFSASWINKEKFLSYFKSIKDYGHFSYQHFVEKYKEDTDKEPNFYKKLLLD